jgi:transcriptional regulator with XRE-family HTH domain
MNGKPSREILMRVARNVKRLRSARDITQQELANVSALTKPYISKIEHGRLNIGLAVIKALAEGLKCEAWEIVTRQYDREGK